MKTQDEKVDDGASLEDATIRKIFGRLMWFLMLMSIAMSLDRTNIGFAALQMNKDLGLTAQQFGMAIGALSVGYIISEIPSNMLFVKFGARIWLPRIAISWGVLSTLTMFAYDANSLYLIRFLLGLAEGGFLPGVILYLSYWLPQKARARGLGMFLVAQALSFIINPILSGPLLQMDGTLGLRGWQWLFLLEGIPSILIGVAAYFYLTSRPEDAAWLDDRQKGALTAALARDLARNPPPKGTATQELFSLKMLLLIIAYFGLPSSIINYVSWSPQIVRALAPAGSSFVFTGFLNAIPAVCCAIAMPLWSAHSDKQQERRWHTILPLLLAICGWLITAQSPSPVLSLVGLSMVLAGTFTAQAIFYTLATDRLSQAARPVGSATIGTCGLAGTVFTPSLTGYLKDLTGSLAPGLYFITALLVIACIGVIFASRRPPVAASAAAPEPA